MVRMVKNKTSFEILEAIKYRMVSTHKILNELSSIYSHDIQNTSSHISNNEIHSILNQINSVLESEYILKELLNNSHSIDCKNTHIFQIVDITTDIQMTHNNLIESLVEISNLLKSDIDLQHQDFSYIETRFMRIYQQYSIILEMFFKLKELFIQALPEGQV